MGSKCLSVNNLSWISLIRGKLFPESFYIIFPPVGFNCVCGYQSRCLSRGNRCDSGHMYVKRIITKFVLCGVITKRLKVVKPKIRFGNFQDFCNNATSTFILMQTWRMQFEEYHIFGYFFYLSAQAFLAPMSRRLRGSL